MSWDRRSWLQPGFREWQLVCVDCGSSMELANNGDRGMYYRCKGFPQCRATHGAHPNGKPLGVPADAVTRAARRRVHESIDPLWRGGECSRTQVYRWLAHVLERRHPHVGQMSLAECNRVLEACAGLTDLAAVRDPIS
jgi:ssDNA-binding Zn-finger/Zn-ribbon topoisomerase 1